MGALSDTKANAGDQAEGDGNAGSTKKAFSAPEDAVSGKFPKEDLARLLKEVGWKKLYSAYHKSHDIPEHMEKYEEPDQFWTRVSELPRAKWSSFKSEGEALEMWRKDARGLLTMSSWSDAEVDCGGADKDAAGRMLLKLSEVLDVKPGNLKGQKYATLVACLGVFLEWYDPGEYVVIESFL